mmetsp:Transcript_2502/g.7799  ORF Transcript_2502/g.7799 Transcript_2502/m.7799 type:complete len:762 (+) Transcript_2502:58-2343(+)
MSDEEEAFLLILPAAVRGGRVSELCGRLQAVGLRLASLRLMRPGADLAGEHYKPSEADGSFVTSVRELAPGPAVATLWRGTGALAAAAAAVGGDSGAELSPSAAEASRLRMLWLSPTDIVDGRGATANFPAPDRTGEKYYITTAINYANGLPHMGHAYEGVCADVIARYHRAYGREVFFLTGADEHGQKISDTAAAQGIRPIELCDRAVAGFRALNAKLGVSNDFYVRTTSPAHKAVCQALWRRAVESGDVYLGSYEGWYNVREETFVTETEAQASEFKDPVSGVPLQKMQESSYMFKMAKYHKQVEAHIRSHPEFIQPESRRNEILDRLKEPLRDLSVSRATFTWGIPVPGDEKHVMYVWFDALTNYLSGIEYGSGGKDGFWPCNVHLIGKDIIWFHCIIWPALLLSLGIPLPRCVLAHGFVHGCDGRKMSKSLGNVVDPLDVLTRHSVDVFRFFLVRDAPFGGDLTFSEDALVLRQNAELADNYGNLVQRATVLCKKDCGGLVPAAEAEPVVDLSALREAVEAEMQRFAIDQALYLVLRALDVANKYVTDAAPWKLPAGDPKRRVVVRTLLEVIYACTHFLAPVLVDAAQKVWEKLGTPPVPISRLRPTLSNLAPGTPVAASAAKDDVLFAKGETEGARARLEEEAAKKRAAKEAQAARAAAEQAAAARAAAGGGGGVAEELHKLDLRVGCVLKVERHPEADTLYVEEVDLGEPTGPRRVVSGLVKYMTAEALLGRRVVLLANTKPSKLKGVESQARVK